MKKIHRTYAFIGLLAGIAVLMGYVYMQRPAPEELGARQPSPVPTPVVLLPERLPELSSPSEKIAQLMAVPVELGGTDASVAATLSLIEKVHPGFVVLFGSRIASDEASLAIASIDGYFADFPVGVAVATDHEGGTVQRLNGTGFTVLPSWQQLCRQQDGTRQDTFGKSAAEVSGVGVDIVFAPVIDLATGSASLKTRACSDPDQISETASDFIRAMRSQGVEPVLKHFPGIGSVRFDTHEQFATMTPILTESQLFTYFLDTFPQLPVMIAHVGLTTLDPTVPCSLSAECISAVSTAYPESLIFSDALEMEAALYRPAPEPKKPLAQVSREALVAGTDVLVYGPEVSAEQLARIHAYLVNEYSNSLAFQEIIEQRLEKVMQYKQRSGFVKNSE